MGENCGCWSVPADWGWSLHHPTSWLCSGVAEQLSDRPEDAAVEGKEIGEAGGGRVARSGWSWEKKNVCIILGGGERGDGVA